MTQYNRKGLSPLIATVLLIAFAVALGTMIMNWSIGQTTTCEQATIEFVQSSQGLAVCYEQANNKLNFELKNTGSQTVSTIEIETRDEEGNINGKRLNVGLGPGEEVILSADLIINEQTTLTITPLIEEEICVEEQLQIVPRLCK